MCLPIGGHLHGRFDTVIFYPFNLLRIFQVSWERFIILLMVLRFYIWSEHTRRRIKRRRKFMWEIFQPFFLSLCYKNVVILMHATIFFLKVGLFFINQFLFFTLSMPWHAIKKSLFKKFWLNYFLNFRKLLMFTSWKQQHPIYV